MQTYKIVTTIIHASETKKRVVALYHVAVIVFIPKELELEPSKIW